VVIITTCELVEQASDTAAVLSQAVWDGMLKHLQARPGDARNPAFWDQIMDSESPPVSPVDGPIRQLGVPIFGLDLETTDAALIRRIESWRRTAARQR
jgi:hypothetical protein